RVHERLSDALLHLVRNAVDHGIEGPDARRAVGKPEEGTIIVHAVQLGSRVIVTVTDDGAGIDGTTVRQRATTAGIDTLRMSDDERYARPMANVLKVLGSTTPVQAAEGRAVVLVNDRAVPLVPLSAVVGGQGTPDGPIIVLSGIDRTLAVRVDALAEQREVLV